MKKVFLAVTFLCAIALFTPGSAFAQERHHHKAPEMAMFGQLFAAISGFAGYYAIRRRKA